MFQEAQIIEFLNKIINADESNKKEIKINVTKFYEYLILTKMCHYSTLERVKKIVDSIDSILIIKENFGYIDLYNIVKQAKEPPTKSVQSPKKVSEEPKKLIKSPQIERHYVHYESYGPSFCGSSSSSSYSSSCGIGSYTRRC